MNIDPLSFAALIIRRFESCRLVAYQDSGGVWTIGWGHTRGVRPRDTCTPALALHAKALNLVEDGRATGWLSPQNAAQWNGWLAAHKNSAESMQNAVTKLTEQLAKAAAAPQDQPA